ncbi:helix-turn-helix domain-containing protein [Streptomyces albireticuli]|uniref:Transcriptional regulator n=1 Tax=Streptomyces albireticuli TaxID=1940 RepID=A0A2A2D3P7_9ACTN|nr:helix-turn-helix transcriptional regulator [Streptomyces albireticuli]MCD9196095.1 helix-turn-helix domain-containing protein [Streptomyces albireticuli]PAU46154.1 transcriptional regulator [Streptomyces albireticuli]
MVSDLPVGARIRYWRRRNGGRSQAAIAGLCGITEDYLSKIERGQKAPSLDVLVALAREIGVPVTALLDHPTPADESAPHQTAPDVARILMGYSPPGHGAPVEPAVLRERVEAAWRTWQTSPTRYTDAATILPTLLADTERTVRAHRTGPDAGARRDALRAAADLYGLLRSYCRRTQRLDLSLLVADRALRAAEDADDPLRIAAAQWNLGHVLLGQREPEGAEQVATQAAEQLQNAPADADGEALAGALHLVISTAAAQRRDWWRARAHLEQQALPRAEAAGEGNIHWTVFGPTNVHLHALGIEMLAGEAAEGLRHADDIDISQVSSIERQFTFLLDVARCYDLRREDAAVLVHLLDIEQLAPEDLTRSLPARQIVDRLRHRVRPTYRRQVEALVERLGIDSEFGPAGHPD